MHTRLYTLYLSHNEALTQRILRVRLDNLHPHITKATMQDPLFRFASVLCGLTTIAAGHATRVPNG